MVDYKEIKTQLWDYLRRLNERGETTKYEVDVYRDNLFGVRTYMGRRTLIPSGIIEEIKFLRKEIELWVGYGENL